MNEIFSSLSIEISIANVCMNLFEDDDLDDERWPSNHDVNGYQLILPTISSEPIEQMPVILEETNNQNLTSIVTASTTFVQDENRFRNQMINSMSSIQVPSAPLKVEINQSLEHESSFQRTETIVIPRTENEITNEPKIEFNTNKNNQNMAVESTSTGANGLQYQEPLEDMVISNEQLPETINLTSDDKEEEEVQIFDSEQNNNQMQPHVIQHQEVYQRKSAENLTENENSNSLLFEDENQIVEQIVTFSMDRQSAPTDVNNEMEIDYADAEIPHTVSFCYSSDSEDAASIVSNSMEAINDFEMNDSILNHEENSNQNTVNIAERPITQNTIGKKYKKVKANVYSNEKLKLSNTNAANQFICKICEYSTNRKHDLRRHFLTHTKNRPYECEFCDRRFNRKYSLDRHKRTHVFANNDGNSKKKPKSNSPVQKNERFNCDQCEFSSKRQWNFSEHIRTHTTERPYECEYCGKSFFRKAHLKHHMKTMHSDLFAFHCSKCRWGFNKAESCKNHEMCCKKKQHVCQFCGKKFGHKGHWIVHLRLHTGEKPFQCSDCPKQFNQKYHLTRHVSSCHQKNN